MFHFWYVKPIPKGQLKRKSELNSRALSELASLWDLSEGDLRATTGVKPLDSPPGVDTELAFRDFSSSRSISRAER